MSADQSQTDTLDEIEILLDSLLKEAQKTNDYLAYFRRVMIVGALVYALFTVAGIVLVGQA